MQNLSQYNYVVEPFSEDYCGNIAWGTLGNMILRCASMHPPIPITDTFDQAMLDAVYAFQSAYGLKVDGVVGRRTWNALQNVYEQTLYTLPEDYQRFAREVYPGRFLVPGDTGEAVTLLQTRLNQIAAKNDAVPAVTVDGVYGQETARAVRAVQRLLGYIPTGAVGPVLWAYIITQGQGYGEV